MSNILPPSLSVFIDDQLVGAIYPTDPLSFAYDNAYLASPGAAPISGDIPLSAGANSTPAVHAFFENLLPEGDQRKIISLQKHVSTVYGLLAAAGGDTAGALCILPQGQLPIRSIYQRLTWEQVNALVHSDHKYARERAEIEAQAAGLPPPRISLSGAQFKLLLALDEHGMPLRPMGSTPSTHILKPDIVRGDIHLFDTAANEAIVMRAATYCEMPTASVSYQSIAKACLVERFDRQVQSDGSIRRLWQADLCQLLSKPSDVKYELDGGPTFKECFELIGKISVQPGPDKINLLKWLFFNLYVGNNDSHAKNLSILVTKEGPRLAPFYDLMSTRVYTGLGPNFAFSIGGEFEPGKMTGAHLKDLARSLKVSPKFLRAVADDMATAVIKAVPRAAADPTLGVPQSVLTSRLEQKIGSITKRTVGRLLNENVQDEGNARAAIENAQDIDDPERPGM